ncbi:MAG: hypothetical protein JWO86_6481 [Myxococcaceae bacterium]|nr:hypothetical protein [Myxococcaceae bacterium]
MKHGARSLRRSLSTFVRPFAALFFLGALASAATGCFAKSTAYNGKFTFAYAAGLDFENFVKPIAPGAKLDVVAFANGSEDKLVITSAKSSKSSVLAVETVGQNSLVLKAVAPGVADVEITARDAAGKTLVDHMFFHVEKPTVHALTNGCGDENGEAIYVRDDRVFVSHRLSTSDGRPVIGYGYAPLRVEPAGAFELVPPPQGATAYAFKATTKNARITVRSTVDNTAVSFRVIERGELKDATLDCGDCRVLEGESQYLVARVRLGETPICSQNALTKARSLTPEICAVNANLDDDDGTDSNREQLALVSAVKFGVCKYEITLPELDGGRGIRLTGEMKVGRVQFPSEGGSAGQSNAREQLLPHEQVLRRTAVGWLLFGLGWTAPNLVVLACIGWALRRRR